jgi:hypothetical protein
MLRENLRITQSWQKSYADEKRRVVVFPGRRLCVLESVTHQRVAQV